MITGKETAVVATGVEAGGEAGSSDSSLPAHASPEIIGAGAHDPTYASPEKQPKSFRDRIAFLLTKDFWFILTLGQALAVCITGTNTLTSLLVEEGTSIPAFQTLFNYVLLNVIYTGFTFYKYGFKGWCRMVLKDGWKCIH